MTERPYRQPQDLRVLVVEDEPRLRDVLLSAIPDMGFHAEAVHSAEAALQAMREAPRDVLVLDLNLPGITGMDMFQTVAEQWPDTEVIIITGYGDLEAAKTAIRLNVVDFLTKPVSLGELEQSLERARRRILDADKAKHGLVGADVAMPPGEEHGPASLEDVERETILAALQRHNGNRSATAAELGISVRTLYYRLSEYQKQGYSV